ncbi:PI-PLC X domain-containing protein 1-like [Chanos chanos]|uniref:PI-PLC X domain-containing protein 1-like n=1 Tax=Chanos chanos TaxID=29144 RepID=A0A6J2W3C0_CHACN|nr:PI-PLC X domain-containing protein 1-like [Chanos chanos]
MSSCVDWMSRLPEKLLDMPLSTLAIPGSHDTMTYCLDQHSPVLPSQPKTLRFLDSIIPCIIRPCVNRWGTTQERTISSQLDSGIRFLDLRVAHKKKDSNKTFYFAHGIYSLWTVKEALIDVAWWLEKHPKEVVIIALSSFDGLDSSQHQELINHLKNLFLNKLCPNWEKPTLKTCWDHGYQVILSYDNSCAVGHKELWPKWDYWWANKSDPTQVISYLEERKAKGRPDSFFVAGLNMTEDARYILLHPCRSMRIMTKKAYPILLNWVKDQCPGSGKTCINIICADFIGFSSNVFAQSVIELNQRLLKEDMGT